MLRLPVAVDQKWGYVDERGEVVIPLQYDSAMPFSDGVAPVWLESENALLVINEAGGLEGKTADAESYYPFSEGRLPFFTMEDEEEVEGYLDRHGKVVVPPAFTTALPFIDGLAVVESNGQFGVIDRDGRWVIPPRYTSSNAFHDGLGLVYVGGERDGDYDLVNGKFGYVDRDDQLAIAATFDDALNFCGGVAQVMEFEQTAADQDAVSVRTGWIDRVGKYLWRPTR